MTEKKSGKGPSFLGGISKPDADKPVKPDKPTTHKVRAAWGAPQNGVILVHTFGMPTSINEYRLLDAALYNGSKVFNVPLDDFLSARKPENKVSAIAQVMPTAEDVQLHLWRLGALGPEYQDNIIRSAVSRTAISGASLKKALTE